LHLKSLTLRGFKSFASATTLRFEPGITAVVGPNGSGKSNVVDAIAWVLGEQGAKSLRGGKMEDVIFAGTAGRAPLGRAEVVLTVDNSDGALPLDYREITISRLMYRSGESEYSINGSSCRLLDVQELLSDSGIGREMHVIVGQGQLDTILSGRPEDRRAFIEEAAGVAKHRKRKEKALRKLEAMQANLTRLPDLNAALRRQLGPLGRQAEVARRAATVQAELRDARLRLLADEFVTLAEELERDQADEQQARTRREAVEAEHASLTRREQELEAELAAAAPRLADAQEIYYRLATVADRLRATGLLAADRDRLLAAAEQAARTGPDPEELDAAAEQVRRQEAEEAEELAQLRAQLADRAQERSAAEARLEAEELRARQVAQAAADHREGLARAQGELAALASRVAAAEAELERLGAVSAEAAGRAIAAQADYRTLEAEIAGLDAGESGLDERHEIAAAGLQAAEARLAALRLEEREAERHRSALQARREALALSLDRRDAGAVLLAAAPRPSGVHGGLADLLRVEPGYEVAIAAALGPLADAVAVAGMDVAVAAIERVKQDGSGRLALLVGGESAAVSGATGQTAAPIGRRAVELVQAPDGFEAAVARLLAGVVVVEDLAAARSLLGQHPELTAVTRDGDVFGRGWAAGGSAGPPSRLEVQAALDETDIALAAAEHDAERLRFALNAATGEQDRWRAEVEASLAELHDSDARLAAVAERLGQLGAAARAAFAEQERAESTRAQVEAERAAWLSDLAELQRRLDQGKDLAPVEAPSEAERDRATAEAAGARAAEVEARLAVRTAEERVAAVRVRAEQLVAAAAAERAARSAAAAAAVRREAQAGTARAVGRAVEVALPYVERSLLAADAARAQVAQARILREGELQSVRAQLRQLVSTLDALTGVVHRDELLRAEQRARIDALAGRALTDFGVEPKVLVDEYGPTAGVPLGDEVVPYLRAEQEKRARGAERSLAALGRVNPLALEEYAALEERAQFLGEQLEDLRATRRDLLTVVREVDERVLALFTAAYQDTAREFEAVFETLFPGGAGRLVLTDPEDPLASGIEIEARPPGKKVKRLSLLSGGERSLTAIALLVAIFRARPSPFYVLDEVEAALDDRNLERLLRLLEQLRTSSQLLVVTHQKRTMEVADVLYGVTMGRDGVSEVVSQRLREREPV
jgi:chromosome segregation protein